MTDPSARRNRRQVLRLLGGLIGGCGVLAACTPAPGSLSAGSATASAPTSAAATPTIVARTGSSSTGLKSVVFGGTSPANLNPLLLGGERSVTDLLFDALVKPDASTGNALPNLAQSWDTSPDGLTWSFHLQPNVTWSDGQPFSADDVKFTFDVALGPTQGIAVRSAFDNIAGYDAPDPHTFRVNLKQAECPFLVNTMLTPILPRHLLSGSTDIAQDDFNRTRPVGTGPFMLKEWVEGDHLTLVANPNHWQGPPKIDQWIHRPINGQNGSVDKLKVGEIDYAKVAATFVDELKAEPNLNVISVTAPTSLTWIAYNLERPLFQDKRVRLALGMALDRQAMVDSVLFGIGKVEDSIIPEQSWAFPSGTPGLAYDMAGARKLLADAGWTPGADGILQKDASRFAFTLINGSGNVARSAVAVIAQDAWRKLGIDMQVLTLEGNAFNAKYQSPGPKDFDAIVLGATIGQALDPDQTQLLATSQYPNGGNFMHYSNPSVDQLLAQARSMSGCDPRQRKALYAQLQQVLSDDQPFTVLYAQADSIVINKRLQNVTPNPWTASPYLAWSIRDWTLAG